MKLHLCQPLLIPALSIGSWTNPGFRKDENVVKEVAKRAAFVVADADAGGGEGEGRGCGGPDRGAVHFMELW